MSLFQAKDATSYTQSTSEVPKWMQDAIYSQIQSAQNVANMPYQQYGGQTVAGMSPYQQAAYQQVAANQGKWQPALSAAAQGMQEQATGMWGTQTAAPYLNQAAFINQQEAARPFINQSAGTSSVAAANPYLQQASTTSGLSAAMPYFNQADNRAYEGIGAYMNPYQQNVMDVIAKQGARNLSENLLPAVSDSFIKAGGFGGTRMGEFGSRAVRDTQESILNQQAQLANQGYTQAMGASQADLARQAQIGQSAGNLAAGQQSALMGIGSQLGQLTQADAARQLQAGQLAGQMAQGQQSALAGIGGQFGNLAQQDLARQQSALNAIAQFGQMGQQMSAADVAALEAAGKAQQGQQQAELTDAYNRWQQEQMYPRQTLDWLSTQIRGMAPITPQSTTQTTTAPSGTSPLSQIATALAGGAGLYNALK